MKFKSLYLRTRIQKMSVKSLTSFNTVHSSYSLIPTPIVSKLLPFFSSLSLSERPIRYLTMHSSFPLHNLSHIPSVISLISGLLSHTSLSPLVSLSIRSSSLSYLSLSALLYLSLSALSSLYSLFALTNRFYMWVLFLYPLIFFLLA